MVSRWVALTLALLLVVQPVAGRAAQSETSVSVETPFYSADFLGGGLTLRDPTSGVPILQEQAPELCLGEPRPDQAELMPNGSFEALNATGSPKGWSIYRPYISMAGDGTPAAPRSLAWQLDAPDDPNSRGADSPAAQVRGGERYMVTFDWTGQKVSGSVVTVFLAWYADPSGEGQRNTSVLRQLFSQTPKGSTRGGHEAQQVVVPPQARSVRILFRAAADLTGSLALENLGVEHLSCARPAGAEPTVTRTERDDGTSQVVSELTWGDVRVRRTWQLSRTAPVVQLTAEFTYSSPTYVTSEQLQFSTATTRAQTIGRDLRPAVLTDSIGYVGDALSPRLLDVPGAVLVRADGAQSTLAWSDGSNAFLNAYADLSTNHPLGLVQRGQEGKKTDVSQTFRKAGDTSTLELQILVGEHSQPVAVARQPGGFEATLAFSEHADGANLAASSALDFGTSDTSDPTYGRRGFVGNGLRYTKSVFAFPSPHWPEATLQSAEYAAHLIRLAGAGVEIIPHTITAVTDDRATTQAGLDLFARFGARNWIDHGNGDGINNLEALTSEGMLANSEFRIIDLLQQHGYRYAWSNSDYEIDQDNINLLRPDRAWETRALAFSLTRDDGLVTLPPGFVFWSTAIPTVNPEQFVTPRTVQNLVSQRGVYVSHDYFPRARHEGKLFQTNDGVVSITAAFENSLEAIAAAQQASRLWVPTISEMLDFWTALQAVRVREIGSGNYRVVNTGERDLAGVTLMVGSDAVGAVVGGQTIPLEGQKLRLPLLPAHGDVQVSLQLEPGY